VLSGAPNARGQTAQNGEENLYLFEDGCPAGEAECAAPVQRTVFIADLVSGGAGDESEWNGPLGVPANVTPDGRYLVFLSGGDLTADDTSTSGAQQVFRYDAQTGELTRVSIGNEAFNDNGNAGSGGTDASIAYNYGKNRGRRDLTMSDDGSRVFFRSPVGLTAKALNDFPLAGGYGENVYEWEQEGVGSCPARQSTGCVYLISDGHDTAAGEVDGTCHSSPSAVCLLGSDATGANVFFATTDQLVPKDTDSELDYYDARICTEAEPCSSEAPPPLPPCDGEDCHGVPPGLPSPPSAPSTTFNGQGNLVSPPPAPAIVKKKVTKCKRGYVKKKVHKKETCVKKKHKKSKNAKKASNDWRPGR